MAGYIEIVERPDEDAIEKHITKNWGGLCTCGAADPCPLGRTMSEPRCRANELRNAMLEIQAKRK